MDKKYLYRITPDLTDGSFYFIYILLNIIKLNNDKIKIKEPFKGLFTQGMVCHETYKNDKGEWLSPEEAKKTQKTKVITGPSEAMSKSKKNVVDPESMIKIYGADAIRWFMLSDSPPDRDIQWSNEGVSSAHKFVQRLWNINIKIINRKDKKISKNEEKKFLSKFNKYLIKISSLIEKFHLNVAIANFYELTHLVNDYISKDISTNCLKETQIKIMRTMMPFIPHITCECLAALEGENFFENNKWPQADKSLLEDSEVTIVVQINGKKRGLLSASKDIEEKEAITKAKNIENIKKNLINKKIVKNVFVKNKVINFIIS